MARIAFYAPLKSPDHPVPSGEREMARNLLKALARDGHQVERVSEFRSLDKQGDPVRQAVLITQAEAEVRRLVAKAPWQAWVTYHSYYKAPDLLGPAVCDALGIPYLTIEATRAAKRLSGPWAVFEERAAAACDRADVLFHFTARDADGLRPFLRPDQRLVHLAPFLGQVDLPHIAAPCDPPIILLAGMMRPGDKLASYEIAARTLAQLPDGPWQAEIAGDGPMRDEVAALFAPFGQKVVFLGQLDSDGMAAAYRRARAFFWPGVNEAFGMVYLEAQAAGVPVAAEDREGVRDVVAPGGLVPAQTEEALAAELHHLLNDTTYHARRAQEARTRIAARHLIGAARDTLWGTLAPMIPEAE